MMPDGADLSDKADIRTTFFSDALVKACAEMIRQWNPAPAPGWVTCVPSWRHPDLVPNFAQRLADALSLPFQKVIARIEERPKQKTMANSSQQARNIDGSLAVKEQKFPKGSVFLVDDTVDSRWTLTVCSWLLRSCGCGEVWPVALAQTGYD